MSSENIVFLQELRNELRNGLHKIEVKVDSLTTHVSTLTSQVNTLTGRVDTLTHNFTFYKHQESTSQEIKQETVIYDKLNNYLPTKRITMVTLKQIYDPIDGKDITEFDGCIYINSTPIHSRKIQITPNMPNNSLGYIPTNNEYQCIIIESKRSLTKYKIDTKLKNIQYFMKILNEISLNDVELNIQYRRNKTIPPKFLLSEPFCSMYITYNLHLFPKNIYILFGADDISYIYKEFLLLLNRGITIHEYNNILMKLFVEDDILHHIYNNDNIDPKIKQSLKSCKTITRLNTLLENDSLEQYRNKLLPYCQPYSEVSNIYRFAKNKIGFLHIDKLILRGIMDESNTLDNYLKSLL
jgi:hypothetical protein